MVRPIITGTANADWLHLQAAASAMEVTSGAGDDGIFAGAFDDLLRGGEGNDLLWGNAGNDTILGEAGNDQAWGGDGNDSLDGGEGQDLLWGDAGNDTLRGGAGQDQLWGGEGEDSLDGGAGNDMLWGGQGNDTLALGEGNDQAWGEDGNDRIATGTGNDTVWAGQGDDSIDGGAGDDSLTGEAGNDTILAGEGRNIVSGGEGQDSITAGGGHDTITGDQGDDVIAAGQGNNLVHGGEGQDRITAGTGNDTITGDQGNDVIDAGAGDNTVWSGQGDDSVITGAGNDEIGTDEGNDTVQSGAGHDRVYGNGGNDSIDAGEGNDFVTGDMGQDSINGGAGNDSLFGGEGNDLIIAGEGADRVQADGGNDTVVHSRSAGGGDFFNGGAGFDTLAFDMTLADWQDSAFQTELQGYLARLGAGKTGLYSFTSQGLQATNFEAVGIKVDGQTLTAADDAVTARADAFSVTEDAASLSGNLLANDTVADLVAKIEIIGAASEGTLNLGANGAFTWAGGDAFQALKAGESRAVTFSYRVTDSDGDTGTAEASITVQGQNDGPVAVADEGKTDEDTATKIDLLGNDSDVDGDALTLVGVSASEYGASIKIDGGAVVYDPTASAKLQALGAGETATDSFTYTVRDANGAEVTQTVTITVGGLDDKEEITGKLIASFEDGLGKGWQDTGDVETVKGGTEGKMAARLSTDDAKDQKQVEGWLQLGKGTLDKLGYGDADEGSAIRGKVELEEGQTLNFDWLFGAAAKSGGNDFAFVTLRHDGENEVFGLADVKAVGEGKNSGWQSFSFKADEAGSYEIGIGVMDVGSSDGHATLLLDNIWIG
ncbi:cadherin-like domain-containing protein [Roseococcus sp. SDR]|uniref:Ig-like domain-containing protein n=1 Tax=Roseococcus sp. SDR TaxID=2835532 RepID=UPI001BD03010|nr:Ig-like domain-containing protein [Roseococcus sp. SDR]MBS7791988.1 cadherin-like domain-containing protein [Roseococcus sp. SDR]MBV1847302.1 cadherin-like domain-containing protein [Roseococcus sp. SDR]